MKTIKINSINIEGKSLCFWIGTSHQAQTNKICVDYANMMKQLEKAKMTKNKKYYLITVKESLKLQINKTEFENLFAWHEKYD